MAFNLNTTPLDLLGTAGSSSTGPGQWYRVHPDRRNLTFQIIHTGTSVGATVQSTTFIQVSNDGVTPLETTGGSSVDALGVVALNGGSPQSAGFGIAANWEYIRANINALSTG